MQGFRQLPLQGNVIDLAVAVVIGGAFIAVVQAFVKGVRTLPITAIVDEPGFSQLTFTMHNSTFSCGDFINAVVA